MNDESDLESRAVSEFADAVPVERFHRYYVSGTTVHFGLLGKDGFANTEAGLNDILAKEHSRLGADVVGAIRDLKPFKGGNKLLRGLHDLDVLDKHRLIVPAYLAKWHRYDHGQALADALGLPEPVLFMTDGTIDSTFVRPGERIRSKLGIDPLKYLRPHDRGVVSRFPSLVSAPFAGEEVVPTLHQLKQMVAKILLSFQAKFSGADPHV